MDLVKSKLPGLSTLSSRPISIIKSWTTSSDNGDNTKQKVLICVGSVWIITDFVIAILQRTTDVEDTKNVLGPFTYIAVKTRPAPSDSSVISQLHSDGGPFGIYRNREFMDSRGLACNVAGGVVIGFGLGMSTLSILKDVISSGDLRTVSPWSVYVSISSVFYLSEYLWAALFHPDDVNFSSFMLFNHSNAFHIALCLSATEYWTEYVLFPNLKNIGFDDSNPSKFATWKRNVFGIGMLLSIGGQCLRTVAQFTAGINFTHQIAFYKKKEHTLITHGVYRVFRHPSYLGFFWWSIGTQLVLNNPLSAIIYTAASWSFFARRIPMEEEQLLRFFGNEYEEYRKRTITGIPFIP